MSQEKVKAYKEEKANRKANLEAARRKKKAGKVAGIVITAAIAVALVVALVITGINMSKSYKNSLPNYDAEGLVIGNYVTEETEAEETTEAE